MYIANSLWSTDLSSLTSIEDECRRRQAEDMLVLCTTSGGLFKLVGYSSRLFKGDIYLSKANPKTTEHADDDKSTYWLVVPSIMRQNWSKYINIKEKSTPQWKASGKNQHCFLLFLIVLYWKLAQLDSKSCWQVKLPSAAIQRLFSTLRCVFTVLAVRQDKQCLA